jgi:epoxyqueuosine reductase
MHEELRSMLISGGAAVVGFANLGVLPAGDREGCPTGVSIAVSLDRGVVLGLGAGPTGEYYAEYKRVNTLLDELSAGAVAWLKERGFRAAARKATVGSEFDREGLATRLPHKTLATRAGLGWIGKTALLITETCGSAIRLTSVLTDAPLSAGIPVEESRCGDCDQCVRACPAGASRNSLWRVGMGRAEIYDAFACRAKARELAARAGVDESLCGICIRVCPWTQRYLDGR